MVHQHKSTETVQYTVIGSKKKKKRNNSFAEWTAVEESHHYPSQLTCTCCEIELHEIGTTVVREEAKFIPDKIVPVQHIEHAYECKQCKKDLEKKRKSFESSLNGLKNRTFQVKVH